MKKILKVGGMVFVAFWVVCIVALAIIKVVLDAQYFEGYDPNAPLNTEIADVQEWPKPDAEHPDRQPVYMRTKLYINGFRNDRVPVLLAMPRESEGPFPCVIFLHGIGQKKEFLDEIAAPFVNAGFAFVSFDQLMQGERKLNDRAPLNQAGAFRVRPAYTINDTRRLIDYLDTRLDIAVDRIYLCGASYGAITGATAAAFDTRIRAAVLTYGGGDISEMLTARAIVHGMDGERGVGNWLIPVQVIGWYLLSASDPVKYIGQIAPRPVFLQNGTDDCLIATSAAKALQAACNEPKTIKWYEGDHIGFVRETVLIVLDDVLQFVLEQDARICAETTAPREAA